MKVKKELWERCTEPLRILNMLIKFCPASPHVCPGGCVCVCVLTAANFSYMSIFLHIRSLTHTHTRAKKTRWSFAWARHENVSGTRRCSLVAPGAGFSNFWLLDLNDERCHKGPYMLASSHTHRQAQKYTCLASLAQNDVEEAFINWPLTLFLSVDGVCSKWGSRFGFIAFVWLLPLPLPRCFRPLPLPFVHLPCSLGHPE